MRIRTLALALLLGATFSNASSFTAWTSTSDTTARAINTAINNIAVGAEATTVGGKAVAAKAWGTNGIAVNAEASGSGGMAVKARAPSGTAVDASASGYGVYGVTTGSGFAGVYGTGPTHGVEGYGTIAGVHGQGSGAGVEGWSSDGYGVLGVGMNGGVGVRGSATNNYGVEAHSQYGIGLSATSTTNFALSANSTQGTGLIASGKYTGAEIGVTDLYGSGLYVSPGGRGYAIYTYGGSYGVYGSASSYDGSDITHGVVGDAYGGDVTYGVMGYANGGNYENWAGYFEGDVYIGGYLVNPSDLRFKTNIQDYRGGLGKIMALRIRSYDMKVDEYKGRVNLPPGPQVGVIAQEAEKVFPEIVRSVTSPARMTPEERKKGVKKESVKFKSVDYEALIPVLVQAIQELQAQVDSLKGAR
jgi:hypothetical protein